MAIPIKAVLTVSTQGFKVAMGTASKVLGGFVAIAKAATFALVGLTAAFTALVLRQSAIIDRIGKVSKVTGVAAETLQKFSFAAELAGVSTDQAQVALRRFSRRLGEAQKGTGELAPTLKRLGIQLRDGSGQFKSAEDVLLELSDAIAGTDDQSQRLAIAFKAFDSEGAELVNVLSQGSQAMSELFDEATRLGIVLNTDAIQGVEDFNDELNKLQGLIGGVTNQFVAALAPALQEATEAFKNFILENIEAQGGIENFGIFLKDTFLKAVISVVNFLELLANAFIKVINVARSAGRAFDPTFGLQPEDVQRYNELNKAYEQAKKFKPTDIFKVTPGPLPIMIGSFMAGLTKGGLTGGQAAAAIKAEMDALFTDIAPVSFESIVNLLTEQLSDGIGTSVERVKEFKVATVETNRELDLTLGYWERIILQIGDFFTRDLPQSIRDTITLLKSVGKSVAERLLELQDPVKTLEDGLVKAGQSFEDALVNAILTGKSSFEDFRNIIKETLVRAFIQSTITNPLTALFKAKGGPVGAGNPYIVGEKGPELFIPGASGTIIPNNQLSGNGGGAGMTNVYNINAVDTQSFQQALARDPEFIYSLTRVGARRTPA